MSDVDLDNQGRIPIFILNPTSPYVSDTIQIKQYLRNDSINSSRDIIVDLSNFFRVDADLLNHLRDLANEFSSRVKRFGLIIPNEVMLDGLKIKLIDDLIEIYGNKYDAVYDLLN